MSKLSFSDDIAPSPPSVIDQYLDDYKDTPMTVHNKEEPEPEQAKEFESTPETMTLSGEVLSGTLFLTLIESIMPLVIGILSERFDNKKVDVKKLKLTAAQRKELEPICDAVVKQMNVKSNPIVLLVISLLGIYGLNYMALREDAPTKQFIKKN